MPVPANADVAGPVLAALPENAAAKGTRLVAATAEVAPTRSTPAVSRASAGRSNFWIIGSVRLRLLNRCDRAMRKIRFTQW
jgi:hypothetical protein